MPRVLRCVSGESPGFTCDNEKGILIIIITQRKDYCKRLIYDIGNCRGSSSASLAVLQEVGGVPDKW